MTVLLSFSNFGSTQRGCLTSKLYHAILTTHCACTYVLFRSAAVASGTLKTKHEIHCRHFLLILTKVKKASQNFVANPREQHVLRIKSSYLIMRARNLQCREKTTSNQACSTVLEVNGRNRSFSLTLRKLTLRQRL